MGEIDIEVKVCMKMWSELASMILFFIETQSTTKELQNKTNPRSIALLVWKWRSDEGDRVRENPSKPSKFCLFTVLNHIVTGGEAKTSQYLDTIQQKSYFLSFLMQFSDFKSLNWLRKCVVFFGPDWLGIPCSAVLLHFIRIIGFLKNSTRVWRLAKDLSRRGSPVAFASLI